MAEDDEARWLVGEPSAHKGPQPRAAGAGTSGRRLVAVGSDDEELPLGEDAIDLVSDPAPVSAPEETTEDFSETAAAGAVTPTGSPPRRATGRSTGPLGNRPTEEPAADGRGGAGARGAAGGRPAAKRRKNRGRPSVPSWDEIMFGGGKSE